MACAIAVVVERVVTLMFRYNLNAEPFMEQITKLVLTGNVDRAPTPEMASEDFAYMLQAKPGCYVWLGAGRDASTPSLHSPHYDFNDDVLAIGASYWVTLAEQQLASGSEQKAHFGVRANNSAPPFR